MFQKASVFRNRLISGSQKKKNTATDYSKLFTIQIKQTLSTISKDFFINIKHEKYNLVSLFQIILVLGTKLIGDEISRV